MIKQSLQFIDLENCSACKERAIIINVTIERKQQVRVRRIKSLALIKQKSVSGKQGKIVFLDTLSLYI